jgi:hypothetical protein
VPGVVLLPDPAIRVCGAHGSAGKRLGEEGLSADHDPVPNRALDRRYHASKSASVVGSQSMETEGCNCGLPNCQGREVVDGHYAVIRIPAIAVQFRLMEIRRDGQLTAEFFAPSPGLPNKNP